jgi:hypothetical protein
MELKGKMSSLQRLRKRLTESSSSSKVAGTIPCAVRPCRSIASIGGERVFNQAFKRLKIEATVSWEADGTEDCACYYRSLRSAANGYLIKHSNASKSKRLFCGKRTAQRTVPATIDRFDRRRTGI